jgi:hypothetical protein
MPAQGSVPGRGDGLGVPGRGDGLGLGVGVTGPVPPMRMSAQLRKISAHVRAGWQQQTEQVSVEPVDVDRVCAG